MRFKEGNDFGKGRVKGSANKATGQVREAFNDLIENNLEGLQEDLDSLEPKDRLKLLIDLAGFCVPRMKAIEINDTSNEPQGVKMTNG